jgi:hypothetical protein
MTVRHAWLKRLLPASLLMTAVCAEGFAQPGGKDSEPFRTSAAPAVWRDARPAVDIPTKTIDGASRIIPVASPSAQALTITNDGPAPQPEILPQPARLETQPVELLPPPAAPAVATACGNFFDPYTGGDSTWDWDGGFELTFVRPFADLSHGAVLGGTVTSNTKGTPDVVNADVVLGTAKFGMELAPRFWIGLSGADGAGVRARYWFFNHGTPDRQGHITVSDDANTDNNGLLTTTLGNRLAAYVADFEVTAQGDWCNWWLLGAAGFRYLNLTRHSQEHFNFAGTGNTNNFDLDVCARDNLSAYGLTVALEAKRFACWGNFLPFINSRFSILAGDTSLRLNANGNGNLGGGDPTSLNLALSSGGERAILIGELQAGVEWNRSFRYGEFFVRGALEAQYWINAVGAGAFGGVGDVVSLAAASTVLGGAGSSINTDRGALSFIGVVIGAGIRR